MTVQGEVYVTIRADAVDVGIGTLAVSGSTEISGGSYLTVVIRWIYNSNGGPTGISGVSWFCDDPNSPTYTTGHSNDDEFNNALAELGSEEAAAAFIEELMDAWTPESKEAFWGSRRADMYDCLDIVATSSG